VGQRRASKAAAVINSNVVGNFAWTTNKRQNQLSLEIKRPISLYIINGFLVYATFVYSINDSSISSRLVFTSLTVLGVISLVRLLRKRNYFEIKDKRLFIHWNFAKTQVIELRDISRVDLGRLIFIPSKIYLKDGLTIKYWDLMVTETEIKELLGQFNIPIE
jgi:hypothetical protein